MSRTYNKLYYRLRNNLQIIIIFPHIQPARTLNGFNCNNIGNPTFPKVLWAATRGHDVKKTFRSISNCYQMQYRSTKNLHQRSPTPT